jgi:hypothetical protein
MVVKEEEKGKVEGVLSFCSFTAKASYSQCLISALISPSLFCYRVMAIFFAVLAIPPLLASSPRSGKTGRMKEEETKGRKEDRQLGQTGHMEGPDRRYRSWRRRTASCH